MWHYTDGKITHGPIDESALHALFRSGTVDHKTLIWRDGMDGWKCYGEIFGATQAPVSPQATRTSSGSVNDTAYALGRVNGPAIFMIVNATLTILVSLLQILINLGVFSLGALGDAGKSDQFQAMFQGTLGIIGGVIGMIFPIIVLVGANKMKGLSSYGWAMTAAIMSILCTNPCCCPVGLGAGIWALVVINDPKVKAAFQRTA